MSAEFDKQLFSVSVENWEQGLAFVDKLHQVTEAGAVFSEPISSNGQTIITASELSVGLGFGHGFGGGSNQAGPEAANSVSEDGMGGGGGGGGGASNRPVAIIILNDDGVRVEPIFDVTKIAVAFFTMLGGMVMMLSRMRHLSGD